MVAESGAVTILTAAGARSLTRRIVGVLDELAPLIERAYYGRIWEALDYPSWEAYCAAELADRLPRLDVATRRAVVARLHRDGDGMSKRAIGHGIDVADQTVRADVAAVRGAKPRPAGTTLAPAALPSRRTDQAVLTLEAAGPDGLTVTELMRARRWEQGPTSGVLSALHEQGRAARLTESRKGKAVYVHPAHIGARWTEQPGRRRRTA